MSKFISRQLPRPNAWQDNEQRWARYQIHQDAFDKYSDTINEGQWLTDIAPETPKALTQVVDCPLLHDGYVPMSEFLRDPEPLITQSERVIAANPDTRKCARCDGRKWESPKPLYRAVLDGLFVFQTPTGIFSSIRSERVTRMYTIVDDEQDGGGSSITRRKRVSAKAKWKSTGRKARVSVGSGKKGSPKRIVQKTVYANAATGELRIKKQVTDSKGHVHYKYVKFAQVAQK